MKSGILAWRVVLGVLGLVVLGVPILHQWLVWEAQRLPEVDSLQVAALPEVGDPLEVTLVVPDRNPFSSSGEPWTPPEPEKKVEAKPVEALPPLAGVRGLLLLPNLEGALTDQGWVKVGGQWGGATVQSVEGDQVVLRYGAGEKRVDVRKDRPERLEAMKKMGLPPALPGVVSR